MNNHLKQTARAIGEMAEALADEPDSDLLNLAMSSLLKRFSQQIREAVAEGQIREAVAEGGDQPYTFYEFYLQKEKQDETTDV